MMNDSLITRGAYISSILFLCGSWWLFFSEAGSLFQSLGAALLAAALYFVTYVLIRWLYLAVFR